MGVAARVGRLTPLIWPRASLIGSLRRLEPGLLGPFSSHPLQLVAGRLRRRAPGGGPFWWPGFQVSGDASASQESLKPGPLDPREEGWELLWGVRSSSVALPPPLSWKKRQLSVGTFRKKENQCEPLSSGPLGVGEGPVLT